MKLSIFPKAKSHPSGKEEKMYNSYLTSNPHKAVDVEFDSEEELIDIITKNAWSPFVFSEYRRMADFISTDLIAFDIDDGMTIDEAEDVVKLLDICGLCLPSPSHTDENHRFRLVFLLSSTITDIDTFKATYSKLAEYFPVDPQCKDACRFYYGSTTDDGFWIERSLFDPVAPIIEEKVEFNSSKYKETISVLEDTKDVVKAIYGEDKDKIPEQVDVFIRNAHTGMVGEWHNAANSFVFTLALQGIEFETVSAVFESLAPEPLDAHDNYLLERTYKDGQEKRKEEFDKKAVSGDNRRRRSRRR